MSEFDPHPDISNAESKSPEQLAAEIFSTTPQNPCSICILPYSPDQENDAISFNFEILLTIYLEGFMNILDVIKQSHLSQNPKDSEKKPYEIENLIYTQITMEDLKFPEPWFKSFGYTIELTEYTKIKPGSYCKILLSFDPKDRINFLMKDIKTRYHFILNKTYKPTNDITKIYALLSKNNKFFKISFKPYT
ncbi:MAG: hypothetical protein Harvfovirus11_23 [Harvfovirus sp.]|uniref:Uncharacterized protein n=1 Tax=Harvfovirus sp. TaxID=2487768 RepID=A0A3G5A422_9VIRU|nr:MAG: hypothetical protein Harvfovirus11_23 [Harvfovirus sp.]